MYEDIRREVDDESEDLLRTANLSLDILSDLRGDNDDTIIEAPIKEEFLPEDTRKFYSSEYKFSRSDFDNKADVGSEKMVSVNEEEDFYDDEMSDGNGSFFFKILLLIFGISLVVVIAIYLVNYFNRV